MIFAAVENRALLCFHYLLQNKADITIRNRKGWNLIHVAVQKKDIKFVLALLNEGVDPNEGDDTGITFF